MKYLKLNLKSLGSNGYTLVEIVVSLAVIGLFTIALVLNGSSNIKTERFSGNVNEFANTLRQTQVASYTIQTDICPIPQTCFWRGNVLDFRVGAAEYESFLLLGNDVSSFSITADQRLGITGKSPKQSFSLADRGLRLTQIMVNNQIVDSISLAFLAPDGKGSHASPIVDSFDPNAPAYPDESIVEFTLTAEETSLIGIVTYDPKNAKLNVEIR